MEKKIFQLKDEMDIYDNGTFRSKLILDRVEKDIVFFEIKNTIQGQVRYEEESVSIGKALKHNGKAFIPKMVQGNTVIFGIGVAADLLDEE